MSYYNPTFGFGYDEYQIDNDYPDIMSKMTKKPISNISQSNELNILDYQNKIEPDPKTPELTIMKRHELQDKENFTSHNNYTNEHGHYDYEKEIEDLKYKYKMNTYLLMGIIFFLILQLLGINFNKGSQKIILLPTNNQSPLQSPTILQME